MGIVHSALCEDLEKGPTMSTFVIFVFLVFYATLASIGAIKILMFVHGRKTVDLVIGIGFLLGTCYLITHEKMASIPAALGGDLSLVFAITVLSALLMMFLYESVRDIEQNVSRMD